MPQTHPHELVDLLLPRADDAGLAEHVLAGILDTVLVARLPAVEGDEDVLLQLHGERAVRLTAGGGGGTKRKERVLKG